jgi:hypothetical protein
MHADAAEILAETVLARIGQRVAPLDHLPPQSGRRHVAPPARETVSPKSARDTL